MLEWLCAARIGRVTLSKVSRKLPDIWWLPAVGCGAVSEAGRGQGACSCLGVTGEMADWLCARVSCPSVLRALMPQLGKLGGVDVCV